MKPRIQPLASLYFRYGRAAGLESHEVAEAMSQAGLIELIGSDQFRELRSGGKIELKAYEALVFAILSDYKEKVAP